MNDEERTNAVIIWQQKLRNYIMGRTPSINLIDNHFLNLRSEDGFYFIKWTVKVANPFFVDASYWLSFDFVDSRGNPVKASNRWTWFPDEDCNTPYVRMDRDLKSFIDGNKTHEMSGVVKIPAEEVDDIAGISVGIDKTEFDISRFEPRWEPNLSVRSDVIEKQGKIFAIRARSNIFNKEYCTIGLTPVVRIFDCFGNQFRSVRCKEWRLSARGARTFEKYVRLSQKHAEQYSDHIIDFTDVHCLFMDDEDLVRVEGMKGGFLESSSDKKVYEINSQVWNDGFEWVRVIVEYTLFCNAKRSEEQVGRSEIKIAPRSNVIITKTFSLDEINDGNSYSILFKPVFVELGSLYEIPGSFRKTKG